VGDIYSKANKISNASRLDQDLVSKMPWLVKSFSKSTVDPVDLNYRPLSAITLLTQLSEDERQSVISAMSKALTTAESMRVNLLELVEEFVATESKAIKTNIQTK
jgi:hypothetical protein